MRLLVRWINRDGHALYVCYGLEEIQIERRDRDSCLQLRRWSHSKALSVMWLNLSFKNWESEWFFEGFAEACLRDLDLLASRAKGRERAGERRAEGQGKAGSLTK